MDSPLYVVRGRKVIALDGDGLRRAANASQRVVIDLGTGDGRWIYRLARAHPDWCCIGVDANAAAMRKSSWRASRKKSRGGAPNAWYVLASVETLPEALRSIADEIIVQYPWGSLRQMLLAPDGKELCDFARIGRPGATFRFTLNRLEQISEQLTDLAPAYARAGLEVQKLNAVTVCPGTSWGKRLGQGAPMPVLVIEGRVGLNGS